MNIYLKGIVGIGVIVIIVFGGGYILKIYKALKRINDIGIGKNMTIVIEAGEIIDYTAINQKRMGNGLSKPWFTMWAESERNKLIEYMKKNNLMIKPGSYVLNQAAYFKEVCEILEFEQIET